MADEPDAPETPQPPPEPSARERRRARAEETRGKGGLGRALRRYRIHFAILVVFGGISAALAINAGQPEGCPGHWHSSFDVFVEEEDGSAHRIRFDRPKFTLEAGEGMPISSHLHRGSDWQWHFEKTASRSCTPFGDALEYVDAELAPGRLELKGAHAEFTPSQAATYTDNGTRVVQAQHRLEGGSWEPIPVSRLVERQLQPDERVLILYGNFTTPEMASLQQAADSHAIEDSLVAQKSYVPAVGVGLLGVVALWMWHAISRKM